MLDFAPKGAWKKDEVGNYKRPVPNGTLKPSKL